MLFLVISLIKFYLIDEALVSLYGALILLLLKIESPLTFLLHLLGVVHGQLPLLTQRFLQHFHGLVLVIELQSLGHDGRGDVTGYRRGNIQLSTKPSTE